MGPGAGEVVWVGTIGTIGKGLMGQIGVPRGAIGQGQLGWALSLSLPTLPLSQLCACSCRPHGPRGTRESRQAAGAAAGGPEALCAPAAAQPALHVPENAHEDHGPSGHQHQGSVMRALLPSPGTCWSLGSGRQADKRRPEQSIRGPALDS